jgi:putative peptide zinc metalloprotease protein
VLQTVASMVWQFNIFVKTDIYFVICTYFGQPDLDKEAKQYLRNWLYRLSFGQFGVRASNQQTKHIGMLRLFSAIWLLGRAFSFGMLFGVYLPTLIHYITSAVHSVNGPTHSLWVAYDTILFALISLSITGIGMYMWLRQR